jgi:outer membrane protein OmpA-like peptidoglycan-associated protein/tetratricopeptide (TPR) repeat protein
MIFCNPSLFTMINKIAALLFIILVPFILLAQSFDELMKKGNRHLGKREINLALESFLEAEKLEPGNVKLNLQIGRTFLMSDYKYKSLPYLRKVFQLSPNADPQIRYLLAQACQHNYLFDEAIEHYKAYEKQGKQNWRITEKKIRECVNGDSILMFPVAVEIENLGPTINSPENDYIPVITPDENILVFTSRREGSKGGKLTRDLEYFEDIYISYRINGNWTVPIPISDNINTEGHDAAVSISADGKELYFYGEDGNILRSTLSGTEWSKPELLPAPINTEYWDLSVSISTDGQLMFLSSTREGGYGGADLYVSKKLADGKWGPAENLGPKINTPEDEDFPFIHADGTTLYFSSNGHPGLGGHDIFKSEFVNGEWQKPINLGYPVNTPDNNFQLVMSKDKTHAYYSSVQESGYGKIDLYKITFMDELHKKKMAEMAESKKEEVVKEEVAIEQPKVIAKEVVKKIIKQQETKVLKDSASAVLEYAAILVSSETGEPIQGKVTISNVMTSKPIVSAFADENGKFKVFIPEEGTYGISVEAMGYMIYSQKLKIQKKTQQMKMQATIRLKPLEVGSTSIMSNIFFDSGKSSLRTESIAELVKIKEFLEENPTLKIQVNGHTDNVGSTVVNKALSKKRAQSVVDYLIEHGIPSPRLSVMGYGPDRPIASNDDEIDGRELNRRTEIQIISF